jgi:hypothetical protein
MNTFIAGLLTGILLCFLAGQIAKLFPGRDDTWPEPGEAWCVKCCLNLGHTLICEAEEITHHLLLHTPSDHVLVKMAKKTELEISGKETGPSAHG